MAHRSQCSTSQSLGSCPQCNEIKWRPMPYCKAAPLEGPNGVPKQLLIENDDRLRTRGLKRQHEHEGTGWALLCPPALAKSWQRQVEFKLGNATFPIFAAVQPQACQRAPSVNLVGGPQLDAVKRSSYNSFRTVTELILKSISRGRNLNNVNVWKSLMVRTGTRHTKVIEDWGA